MATGSLRLDTRRSNQIENYFDDANALPGVVAEGEAWKRRHRDCVHRPTQPSWIYNCHGLTFGSRRTQINYSEQLRKILTEDGYQLVELRDLSPGDVAIYVEELGEIIHSGIVVEVRRNAGLHIPWILSKWGGAHEVIHAIGDCPYAGRAKLEYFRIVK